MKKVVALFIVVLSMGFGSSNTFKNEQLKYPHVKAAYKEKWGIVKSKLLKAGIDTAHFQIFIRVFKRDGKVEIWARSDNHSKFKLVYAYFICSSSGILGPKRKQGDNQVPEGFYRVSVFQPASEFYLALGVSYPNQADKIKGHKGDLGGDIMIHGNCVTIGCMPLTDDIIKEVYIMAVEARNDGQQNIPIYIFPAKLDATGMKWLKDNYNDARKLAFWENLQQGYIYFETYKILPKVGVDAKGNYTFK